MKNKNLNIVLIVLFWTGGISPSGYEYPGFWATVIPGVIAVGIGAIGLVGYGVYDDYCLRQTSLENQIEDATKCLAKPAWSSKEDQNKLQRKIARLQQAIRERDEKQKKEQEQKTINASEMSTSQSQFPIGKDFKAEGEKSNKGEDSSHFLVPTVNGIPLGQNQSYSHFCTPMSMSFVSFPKTSFPRLSERLEAMITLWSEKQKDMGTISSYNQQEGQYNRNNDDNPFY